jgi:hypothetical protein
MLYSVKKPTVRHFLAVFKACTLGLAIIAVHLPIVASDRNVDFRTDAVITCIWVNDRIEVTLKRQVHPRLIPQATH